ncbi:MAG TPA: YIP1 family protein [Anaerolineales bacterium]
MTNDIPNPPMPNPPPPMMSEPAAPTSFFQTWVTAVTKPSEATYSAMASSSNVSATPAFIWVAVASLIQSFILILVQGATVRQALAQQGLNGNQFGGGGTGVIFSLLCGAPIVAVISVVAFAIGTAVIQWVAKMFGGRGTFNQLAYVFGAIAAPATLVSAVFLLLGAIPLVGICFRVIAGFIGLYVLVLEIMAVKGIHGFGWGAAAGSVLIPAAVLLLLCCCLAFGIGALVGASLGNVFSQLGPFPVPTP